MVNIEVCINCDSNQSVHDSVSAALQGGAATIELCGAMHLDGLTPTQKQIIDARKAFIDKPGLMVMIRPRAGNFCYSNQEINLMCEQIKMAANVGADGIVLGTLNENKNTLAIDSLNKLLDLASKYKLKSTFHRAFDATPNPMDTLEILINLNVNRILTSGTEWGQNQTALDGVDRLNKIINKSKGRIEIVIGGGVNNNNVDKILKQLPILNNKISVHSYSGVQENGYTTIDAVKSLVNEVKNF